MGVVHRATGREDIGRMVGLNFTLIDEGGEIDEHDQYPRFDFHITHNLGKMADKLQIYKCLWRPEENGFIYGGDIAPRLMAALYVMVSFPAAFDKYDAINGWGTRSDFASWIDDLLKTCLEYPHWKIIASV